MERKSTVEIKPAYDDLDAIRSLFNEYTAWLDMDLTFQGFAEEFANLPGKYAMPDGRLYLAARGGEAAGCVALRRFDEARAEIKRLYVRPAFRGSGLGRLLVDKVIADARDIGYAGIVLDTAGHMRDAARLYGKCGFTAIAPYYDNPYPDMTYMRLDL
ncbi:MAG: GNAT family N-acetyltransferase [Planctomycetota bacterium]|nr:GNAT family N-acetyltransferase [Planctomycetota bacterium]